MQRLSSGIVCAVALLVGGFAEAQVAQAKHVFVRVELAKSAPGALDGRLLVFAKAGKGDKEVDLNEFHPGEVWVAAMEVHHLAPGAAVEIDTDELAYPQGFSTIPAGDLEVQAVLDVDHTYNYQSRNPSDWVSPVVSVANWSAGGAEVALTLDGHPQEDPRRAAAVAKARENVKAGEIEEQTLVSPALTRFWGHPVSVKAWVVLPPGYAEHAGERYSDGLLYAWIWREPGFGFVFGGGGSQSHGARGDAADDLGDAR